MFLINRPLNFILMANLSLVNTWFFIHQAIPNSEVSRLFRACLQILIFIFYYLTILCVLSPDQRIYAVYKAQVYNMISTKYISNSFLVNTRLWNLLLLLVARPCWVWILLSETSIILVILYIPMMHDKCKSNGQFLS